MQLRSWNEYPRNSVEGVNSLALAWNQRGRIVNHSVFRSPSSIVHLLRLEAKRLCNPRQRHWTLETDRFAPVSGVPKHVLSFNCDIQRAHNWRHIVSVISAVSPSRVFLLWFSSAKHLVTAIIVQTDWNKSVLICDEEDLPETTSSNYSCSCMFLRRINQDQARVRKDKNVEW